MLEEIGYDYKVTKIDISKDEQFKPEFLNRIDDIILFSPLTKKEIRRIVELQFKKVSSKLKNRDIDISITEEALNKLSSIGRKLGYPSKWNDYSSLNFTPNNYLNNIKEITRFSIKKNHSKLYEEVDRDEWGMPAHMVNAYYHPLLNEIAFPAGIMQAPFFDENYEDAVNLIMSLVSPGDKVLLSPASPSFDMFNNFEHRGDTFKKVVKKYVS